MSRKSKTPRQYVNPRIQKEPRIASEPQTGDALPFQWRTDYMDHGGPFNWEVLSVQEFCRKVVNPLHNIETMEWGAVLRMQHAHTLTWSSIASNAIARLEEKSGDLPPDAELLSVGFSGRERIIGIRDRRYFYLLWWDPFHQVSPSHR